MSAPEASLPSEPASPPSDILTEAREAARKDRNYDSAAVRRVIEDQFRDIYDNNKPYDWQLDVAEALIQSQTNKDDKVTPGRTRFSGAALSSGSDSAPSKTLKKHIPKFFPQHLGIRQIFVPFQ